MRNDALQVARNTFVGRSLLLLPLAALLGGCVGGPSRPSPVPASPSAGYAGAWTGPVIPAVAPDGVLQLTISQSGDMLSGAWTLTSSAPDHSSSGAMSGRVVGGSMSVVLRPANPTQCAMSVSGNLNASTEIAGVFSTFSSVCGGGFSTQITLVRQ